MALAFFASFLVGGFCFFSLEAPKEWSQPALAYAFNLAPHGSHERSIEHLPPTFSLFLLSAFAAASLFAQKPLAMATRDLIRSWQPQLQTIYLDEVALMQHRVFGAQER